MIAPVPREGEPPTFEERRYSERYSCPYDGTTIDELEPRSFSFNSPARRLPHLHRAGHAAGDRSRRWSSPTGAASIRAGALAPVEQDADRDLVADEDHRGGLRVARLEHRHAPSGTCPTRPSTTCCTRPRTRRSSSRYRHERGENSYVATFEGVVTNLERRYRETESEYIRTELEKFMVQKPCPTCGGRRLRPEALAVDRGRPQHLGGVRRCRSPTPWTGRRGSGTGSPSASGRSRARSLKEIVARLGFLVDVGLDYLTLDRASITLSGGEAQRIRLATQIGTTLMGVLYILDEPSIGLHQRDNAKLIATLTRLRDLGNTRARGRARRGDDPDRGLGDRHRARGRRARRRDHRQRPAGGHPAPSRARSPAPSCAASARCPCPRPRRRGNGRRWSCAAPASTTCATSTCAFPLGDVHRGHRRVRVGQEHARGRGARTGRWPGS